MSTPNIYDRWDDAAPFERLLFRSDRILQSAEMNELQSSLRHRLRGIADVMMADGDVMRAAGITVDQVSGHTVCEAGAIYADGAVRGVPPATITIPVQGDVHVGVYLRAETVTELEDPTLLNPAAGTRGYMQPGAARGVIRVEWGWRGDGQPGDFYPIWLVEDGVVRPKDPPPALSAVTQALAKYDRDSAGGSYIVRGLLLQMQPDLPSGEQVYSLAEGAARVGGQGMELAASRRIVYAAQPDLQWVDSEPHQSTTDGAQRINLDRWPAVGVPQVRITSRKTVQLAHGGFTGAADPLPDNGVIVIESVIQGGTTYVQGADYTLAAGQIDWSPSGTEPAPGSSYSVTYQYIHAVDPTDVDPRGFTVTDALTGTLVLVSYHHALRRIDRLCMAADGAITWIKGVSSPWQPTPPTVPASMLALASVHQFWDARRRIALDGVRVVPMQELAANRERLDRVIEDQAELRLAVDISGRFSGIKKGLFADPMISNDMRDRGVAQTAPIVAGAMQLPLVTAVHQLGLDITTRQVPAHSQQPVLSQTMRTTVMQVNPYQAFDPLPREAILKPAVDRWTDTVDNWAAPRTVGNGWDWNIRFAQFLADGLIRRDVVNEVIETSTREAEFLRPISVEFELGLGAGETLAGAAFDGIAITPEPLDGGTLTADANGRVHGRFTVPEGIPVGTKRVEFTGSAGSRATALFTGQGSVTHREMQQVTYIVPTVQNVDPLAQTFTLAATRQVTGCDLWFAARGSSDVLVQLREADLGFPTQRVLTESRIKPAAIATGGAPTRVQWPVVLLEAEREYAIVVMCDDATTALSVAELGAFDEAAQRWVTAQPYQIGVLLSSSNASTWTAHQDRDMAFVLLAAQYTQAERTIDLGTVAVADATDLLVQAFVRRPSAAAGALFRLTLDGGRQITVAPGQAAALEQRYSGNVQAHALLSADGDLAAVLEPGVQLIAGSLQTSGTYISPLINAGDNVRLRVVFEADLPAGSALQVHMQSDADGAPWVEVPYLSSSPQTVGTFELTHELDNVSAERLRVRLTLSGSHTARPALRNLRAVVL